MKRYITFLLTLCALGLTTACEESYLDEVPLDRFSPENLLVNEAGYDAAVGRSTKAPGRSTALLPTTLNT